MRNAVKQPPGRTYAVGSVWTPALPMPTRVRIAARMCSGSVGPTSSIIGLPACGRYGRCFRRLGERDAPKVSRTGRPQPAAHMFHDGLQAVVVDALAIQARHRRVGMAHHEVNRRLILRHARDGFQRVPQCVEANPHTAMAARSAAMVSGHSGQRRAIPVFGRG